VKQTKVRELYEPLYSVMNERRSRLLSLNVMENVLVVLEHGFGFSELTHMTAFLWTRVMRVHANNRGAWEIHSELEAKKKSVLET